MDEDDESLLHRRWNAVLAASTAKSQDYIEQLHFFACKFISAYLRGSLSDPASWTKSVSLLSYVLLSRLREDNPIDDPISWKLCVLLKLIGVSNLAFKAELVEAIDAVWRSCIEHVNFDESTEWQPKFPGLITVDVDPLSTLLDTVLPPQKKATRPEKATGEGRHRRRSAVHLRKKNDNGEVACSSSSEDELPAVTKAVASLPLAEERRPDTPETVQMEGLLSNDEAELLQVRLPIQDFAALLLDLLDCLYRAHPHLGRVTFHRTSSSRFLLMSLRLLLRQVLKDKNDSIGVEWLMGLLSCLKDQQDPGLRSDCLTVLLSIAYHLSSNSGPEFKSAPLTVLVKLNELPDEAFLTDKHCIILAEIAICLKASRSKTNRCLDAFHHTDNYGVPFGTPTKQHICVVANICDRLIRLVSRFPLVALTELRRVAYCCCFSPVVPLLELFQRVSDAERGYVLEAIEVSYRQPGSCRVCGDRQNPAQSSAYARVLFATRSRELAAHLAVVASLAGRETRGELYEKIVVSAFSSFVGIEDLPLVFPLLGSLFGKLPVLCTGFFDRKEYVDLLGTFLFVEDETSRSVSMRLFETIIPSSLVALETFVNIVEDEMNNCLKQKCSLPTMKPVACLLDTFHSARTLVVRDAYIRSRFQFLDTSYRLLLNLIGNATTNTAFQVCHHLLAMLLHLCPLQLWSGCERPLERDELCREIYKAVPKDRENYAKISLLVATNVHGRSGVHGQGDKRFFDAPQDSGPGMADGFWSRNSVETGLVLSDEEPEGYDADGDSDSGLDANRDLVTGPRPTAYPEVAALFLDIAAFALGTSKSAAESLTAAVRHVAMTCLQSEGLLKALLESGGTSRLCRSYLVGYRKFGSHSAELTEALLLLVQLLCKQSINSDELFDLLQLFKLDDPPYETLLQNLNQLLQNPQGSTGWPDRALVFHPFSREDLGPPESWLAQTKLSMLDAEGPWSASGAAAALPLATVTDFDGVALSMWFRTDVVGTTHLVSLGNRQVLLEIWLELGGLYERTPERASAVLRVAISTARPQYERQWNVSLPLLPPLPNQRILGNWAHVFLEITGHNKISILANGQKRDLEGVPCRALASLEVVLLGCQLHPLRIASLMLFKALERGDHAKILYDLGPSFQSLTECTLAKDPRMSEYQATLRPLQRQLALAYQPTDPLRFIAYPRSSKMSVQAFFSSARRLQQLPVEYEVFCFSAEPCVSLEAPHNLYTALASLGGYRVFLFMFAWVVERTDRPGLHSAALGVVLKGAETRPELQADFQREGLGLILLVLEHPKCQLSLSMLTICLAHCSDGTGSSLERPQVLSELLLPLWARWGKAERARLAAFLARCTRLRNPYHIANVHKLVKVNAIDRLLNILKEEYTSDQCSLTIEIAEDLAELVASVLAVTGYQHALLSSLVDFVVLLHDATRSYVVHTRNQRVAWSTRKTSRADDNGNVAHTEAAEHNGNSAIEADGPDVDEAADGLAANGGMRRVLRRRTDEALCKFLCGIYKVFCAVLQQQGGNVASLRPDLLIVLANEPQHDLRVAVVKCLTKYLQVDRDSQRACFVSTNAAFGFQLLANQLSQFECSEEILIAVLELASGRRILRLDQTDNLQQLPISPPAVVWPEAAVVLLACVNRCPTAELAARYVATLSQVLVNCPSLAQKLLDCNVVEHICELLPYLTSGLSQPLHLFLRVLVAMQTAQPTENKAAAASTQLAVHFYTRLYAHFVKSDPASIGARYIPRLYAGVLHGFTDALKHSVLNQISSSTIRDELELGDSIEADVLDESDLSEASHHDNSHGDAFQKSLPSRKVSTAGSEQGTLSNALDSLAGRKVRCSPQVLERQLLLLVELLQYSRPSVLLCAEGFACLHSVLQVLAIACLQTDHASLAKAAIYQLSNLALALLRPTLDVACRLRGAEVLGRTPRLPTLLSLFAANKAQLLAAFLVELSEGSEGDPRAKILLDIVANSLFGDTGPFSCDMKRQKWLAQFEEDRESFLETQAGATLGISQLAASRVNLEQQHVTEAAMEVTRSIVDYQNYVRKAFLSAYKGHKCIEYELRQRWKAIAQRLTHERAVWHMPEFVPAAWELDPTEGPCRMRKRLRRAHLQLESQFWIDKGTSQTVYRPPLVYLHRKHAAPQEKRLHSLEQIRSVHPCSMITASVEIAGEVLVGLESVRFVPGNDQTGVPQSWAFSTIVELLSRRYEHADVAVEIFLSSGLTCLLVFESQAHRHDFCDKLVPNCDKLQKPETVQSATTRWQRRQITNFEYLTHLNRMAGRSFNNLMQYPVFPFILSQYDGAELDLTDTRNFRHLDKPIAVQEKSREAMYVNKYRQTQEDMMTSSVLLGPFHYGSHYSNSGIVLHFLVRLPPFTQAFLSYQDNSFDMPDRTFHSMEATWRLASRDSSTDVKELIPEFFYFPEFLRNIFKFDFGCKQDGDRVNDVRLPPWCENDARLFNLIMMAALECELVTERLNLWIDLVFGYKQQGRAAVEALNVFHPATYPHNLRNASNLDPSSVKAHHDMIKTFGQTPIQLFTQPHPNVNLSTTAATTSAKAGVQRVLNTVSGLRWGSLVGSPDDPSNPECIWSKAFGPTGFGRLQPLDPHRIIGVPERAALFGGPEGPNALLSWRHCDGVLRLKTRKDQVPQPLLDAADDPVSFVCCALNRPELFVGHRSGRIGVFRLNIHPSVSALHLDDLIGHKDIVLHAAICPEFFIVASTSADGSCCIWDLNSLRYVRTILQIGEPLPLATVSPTLGDVAIVQDVANGGSKLHLYSINGVFVAQLECASKVTSLTYSSAPEGANVNLLLVGHQDGSLRLFSSWNLAPVRELLPRMRSPVADAVFSVCNQFIFASDESGQVCAWAGAAHKAGAAAPPKFLQEKL